MNSRREQGGSNAIKGFLFQFDKTILEILDNPGEEVRVEQKEDVEREKYYIQVKNRETPYYPSKIRKATIQLLDLFLEDKQSKFCLYCHFKNRPPEEWQPSVKEIKAILGQSHSNYSTKEIKAFSSHFVIQFSSNYKAGFNKVIKGLKKAFDLKSKELGVMYHAIIRSHLLDLAVKSLPQRVISFSEIKDVVENVRSRVTMDGYQRLMAADKYEKVLKKMYFVHNRANIDNFERLFVIECVGKPTPTDVMQAITTISRRYFIKGKSPQPYILFRKLDDDVIKKVKRALVDKDFFFNDGTWFDGDKCRTDKLFSDSTDKEYGDVKLLPTEDILGSPKLIGIFDEIYEFHTSDSLVISGFDGRYIGIPVSNTQQALKILK